MIKTCFEKSTAKHNSIIQRWLGIQKKQKIHILNGSPRLSVFVATSCIQCKLRQFGGYKSNQAVWIESDDESHRPNMVWFETCFWFRCSNKDGLGF